MAPETRKPGGGGGGDSSRVQSIRAWHSGASHPHTKETKRAIFSLLCFFFLFLLLPFVHLHSRRPSSHLPLPSLLAAILKNASGETKGLIEARRGRQGASEVTGMGGGRGGGSQGYFFFILLQNIGNESIRSDVSHNAEFCTVAGFGISSEIWKSK